MTLARLKETFIRLPRSQKLIGIGALLLTISTFLPWYADLDSYKIGDEFLGVTGPASFIGIAILLMAAACLWIFSYRLVERRVPSLPFKESVLHMAVAAESLFLLIIVNSIYFHPKFGENITLKESGFGMVLAFVATFILGLGAYLNRKDQRHEGDEADGKLEPLIKLNPEERMHSPVADRPQSAPMHPQRQRDPTRSFMFGESGSLAGDRPTDPRAASPPARQQEKNSGSFKIRMDL